MAFCSVQYGLVKSCEVISLFWLNVSDCSSFSKCDLHGECWLSLNIWSRSMMGPAVHLSPSSYLSLDVSDSRCTIHFPSSETSESWAPLGTLRTQRSEPKGTPFSEASAWLSFGCSDVVSWGCMVSLTSLEGSGKACADRFSQIEPV